MNLTMLDLGDSKIQVGGKVEVISTSLLQKNNIYEMAKRSETIPYECLTRLSETIRREVR